MDKKDNKYIETIGRRKTSIARARAHSSSKASFSINDGKSVDDYFKTDKERMTATEVINKFKLPSPLSITIVVRGGGSSSQAEAIRHAISRIVVKIDPTLRKELKDAGFLKRDQRAKERRKFGLKKARKAPQWSKR